MGRFLFVVRHGDEDEDYSDFVHEFGVFEYGVLDLSAVQLWDNGQNGEYYEGEIHVFLGKTDALLKEYDAHPRTDKGEIELDQMELIAFVKFCEESLDRELLVTAGKFLWTLGNEAFNSDFECTPDSEFTYRQILISKTSNIWKTCTLEDILKIDLVMHDTRMGERMDRIKTFQGGEYWNAMLVHVYDHYYPCDEDRDWNQVYDTYAKPIVDKVKANSQFMELLEECLGE